MARKESAVWEHLRFERNEDVAPTIDWASTGFFTREPVLRYLFQEVEVRYWTDEAGQKWGETRIGKQWLGLAHSLAH